MRLLIFDCKKFGYSLHHRTESAEEVPEGLASQAYENALVIFAAVEAGDSENAVLKAVRDIRRIARRNNSKLVVINPFAHLSPALADTSVAVALLDDFAARLRERADFSVVRGIFGWYKEFSIDVNGHRNSQFYREY